MCSGNCNPFDNIVHANGIFGCELWLPFPSIARSGATNRSASDERGNFHADLCCRNPCEGVRCGDHERPSVERDFDQEGDDGGLPGQEHSGDTAGLQREYSGLTVGLPRPTWEYRVESLSTGTAPTDDCCVVVAPEPAPEERPTCTGNWDKAAFPDIACDGSHGLNQLIPDSDVFEGRSPSCCCYCDGHVETPQAYCIQSEDAEALGFGAATGLSATGQERSARFQHATKQRNTCTDAMRFVQCEEEGIPETSWSSELSCEEELPYATFTGIANEDKDVHGHGQDLCLKG